ncbi:MAG: DUF6265 family protein [Planctomycetota bacterium]
MIQGRMLAGTLFLSLAAFLPSAQEASPEVPKASEKLQALAWLEGRWIAEMGDAFLEEVWTPPSGDSMICAFKWTQEGKVSLYELVSIEDRGGEVKMLLRHFNAGLQGWKSEVNGPMVFPLKSIEGQEAVFERQDGETKQRIVYRLEGDVLRAQVVKDDGSEDLRFEFHRAKLRKARR